MLGSGNSSRNAGWSWWLAVSSTPTAGASAWSGNELSTQSYGAKASILLSSYVAITQAAGKLALRRRLLDKAKYSWNPTFMRSWQGAGSGSRRRDRASNRRQEQPWEKDLDDSQMPVPNRVVLDDGPFVHPLLELLDEGRPAGVVLASAADARLLEWRLGKLELLSQLEQEELEAPHERAGQIGGGPPGQFHTPMLEHRQARQRERAQRFLPGVAEVAGRMAGDRRWERILVSGGERWTEPVAAKLPEPLHEKVIRDTRVLTGLDEGRLVAAVTERLHEDHTSREQRLLEQIRDAGQSGALGPSEVVAALNLGRVDHLVYDPEVRYAGSIGANGGLYANAEIGPSGEPAIPEPRLTERLVERALATGARVSPVEGAARGVLSEAAGIGALLRW